MLNIERPRIFPECKNCFIANRRILGLTPIEYITYIGISCDVKRRFFRNTKVVMNSLGISSVLNPLNNEPDLYVVEKEDDVTEVCPGINKSR